MTEVQRQPCPSHHLSQTRAIPPQRTNYGSQIPLPLLSWLTPTDPDQTPLAEIRARYARDGYVWLKRVIPRDDVLSMRERYFEALAPTGILDPSKPNAAREGTFNPAGDAMAHQGLGATPEKGTEALLDKVHSAPEYRAFLAHPELRSWIRKLTGWGKEVMLKRGLVRHNVPGSKCPSGIHYDQLFLRAGDPVFVTAWVPIGDCAADGGGLMYLEGSCALGECIERRFAERQERDGMSRAERVSAFNRHMGELGHLSHNAEEWAEGDGKGRRWLVADYEAGDVVLHSPWMIHSASRNCDMKGRIRLATDLRFYEEGARLDERWTRPFFYGDGL